MRAFLASLWAPPLAVAVLVCVPLIVPPADPAPLVVVDHRYPVLEVGRVVDGDTYDFRVDLGLETQRTLRVRLLGVDTPELRGGTPETKAAGLRAKAEAEAWLRAPGPLVLEAAEKDSFGRWLGLVWRGDESLTDFLIVEGLGVPR